MANGDRGSVLSVEETLDYWIEACNANVMADDTGSLPDTKNDGCVIEFERHNAMDASGSPVLWYDMVGGGHNIAGAKVSGLRQAITGPPCLDANGIDVAWDFLSDF